VNRKEGTIIENLTLGQRIKYIRSIKKIKQSELSKGICSISYLSKVENDSLKPSREVESSLLKRLGIDHQDRGFDQMLSNKVDEWYSGINKEKMNAATAGYHQLKKELSMTKSDILHIKFTIYSLKYFMELGQMDEADATIQSLQQSKYAMTYTLLFHYEYFKGMYHYKMEEYETSLEHLEAAKKYSEFTELTDKERAKLYYFLGLTSGKLNKNEQSIEYTKVSLKISQSLYHFKDCVNGHILLGILYKRSRLFKEALGEYKKARELSKFTDGDGDHILHTIHHNLGTLYSYFQKSSLAIEHFKSSLSSKGTDEGHCTTYLSLSKEYYKSGMIEEAEEAFRKGGQLAQKSENISKIVQKEYEMLKNIYDNDLETLDRKMIQEILPIFEEGNYTHLISEYLTYIGDRYYESGRYKKSSQYYSLSNKYLSKLIK
jgi:HTH-type transcriptional regulator, quorum sensing regulator NprR